MTWATSLSLQKSLFHKAALASAVWGPICRLLRSSALPMDPAANLFRTKVLPVLLQGACMHGLEDNLIEFLSQLQNSLAQQVFDLDTWRNVAVAMVPLGWTLPLHFEVVIEVAKRRYRLWQLPDGDLYKTSFMNGHSMHCYSASKCVGLRKKTGILDWVEWQETQQSYRADLQQRLAKQWFQTWLAEANLSRQPPATRASRQPQDPPFMQYPSLSSPGR